MLGEVHKRSEDTKKCTLECVQTDSLAFTGTWQVAAACALYLFYNVVGLVRIFVCACVYLF